MNTICSWKTLVVIALILFAMLEISQGFAGALTDKEQAFKNVLYDNPEHKEDLLNAYWKTEVRSSIYNIKRQIPIQISQDTWMIDVEMDVEKRLIIYSYGIITDQLPPQVGLIMNDTVRSKAMCADPQMYFFLVNMEGTVMFKHYTKHDPDKPFMTILVSSDNCGDI